MRKYAETDAQVPRCATRFLHRATSWAPGVRSPIRHSVTVSTANNLDPNGFAVGLDGAGKGTIEVNGTLTLEGVPAGTRSVTLTAVLN